ncbi:hypothetical protein K469DRAFT_250453 [Zopfia rhizophila CBS 207.26]|uniref:Copper-fist domain-containing protein n=1 Tax=Zopfia rhizophila CBS 207.26 TaxID=1314779 RepID=A0A6A6DR01_9PEZI|nr:hypothetical protein K469DRAFT_250453 [Zopfia rhizophila CBS 207.26]
MWAEINGERKKVACGPCIRGHRSSKCDHRDRVLVEVRKPGRPLSSCPHSSGSCSCERVVINYTIPKTSECACTSDRPPQASTAGTSNRVQKNRHRKSTSTFVPSSLEKAIKVTQDAETDASSHLTRSPTNPSLPASENSTSNGASPPSSASSTPRMRAASSRKQSYSSDMQIPDASIKSSRSPTVKPQATQEVSDCCKPKLTRREPEPVQQQQAQGCCSSKAKEAPKQTPAKKPYCSRPDQQNQADLIAQMNGQQSIFQGFGNFAQLLQQGQFQMAPHGVPNPGLNYMSNSPANMGMSLPSGFGTPIYNHLASGYQNSTSIPMAAMHNGANHSGNRPVEHNCHCGDACSCFGCAAHPNNATMMEYIRLMHQYMSTGGFGNLPPPTYDLPSYPYHPGYGAETHRDVAFNGNRPSASFAQLSVGPISYQMNMNPMMSIPNTPSTQTGPWQQDAMQAPIHIPSMSDSQYFSANNTNTQEQSLSLKTEESVSTPFADSPQQDKDEETPTLSPSSYFWSELVLPGCNDATGTCQCGDGCECVGCLTHGGHNGVPLDATTTAEQDDFSQFPIGSPNMNQHQYLPGAFSEAPT